MHRSSRFTALTLITVLVVNLFLAVTPPATPRASTSSSTTITCTPSTTSLTLGDSLTIQGKISQPVSGATVTLTYTRPDATTVTRTATTNSTGGYRTSFTPDRAGSWSVYASWSGNDQYLGATSAASTFSVSETYDWPMFHHDLNHTGYSTSTVPDTMILLWSYTTEERVESSPAVADGRVYVGSIDDKVYCLNATTGVFIWSYTTGNDVQSSPAVSGGRVYIGSHDGRVYCLNATSGAKIWEYTTWGGVWSSSPAVAGGKVYVGSDDWKLYSLNATSGVLIWSYTTGNWVRSSPAIANGRIYVGSSNGKIYAFGSAIRYFSIIFKDNSGTYSINPSQVVVQRANGSLMTLNYPYSFTLTKGETLTIRQILWQRCNVVPTPNPIQFLDSDYTWTINCRVYSTSWFFKDNSGNTLLSNPTQLTFTCPNGTAKTLTSYSGIYLQNGTFTITQILWQGNNVKQTTQIFDPTDAPINLTCKVYATSFIDSFKDHAGRTISPPVMSFSLLCPNGTSKLDIPLASYLLQNGTYTWISVLWRNITYYPSGTFDPSLGSPIVSLFRRDHTVIPDPANRPNFKPIVSTISNSSISQLTFSLGQRTMNLTIAGPNGMSGFLNITLPLRLLFPPYTIQIDGRNVSHTLSFNQTHAFIYTTYNHSTHNLQLTGSIVFTSLRTLDGNLKPLPFTLVTIINVENVTTNSEGWASLTNVIPDTYLVNAYWQGSRVNQTTITASFQNMTVPIMCRVYILSFIFKDFEGTSTVNPTEIVFQAPNGTWITLSSFSIPQAQCGVWTIKEVRFKGCDIAPKPSPTYNLEKSYVWSINTEVCALQVTVADPIGIHVLGAMVELLMNGKIFETGITDSSGKVVFANVPRVSYQVKSTYMGLTQVQTVDTT